MTRPPSFLCPITKELLRDPVVCADGHSYERDVITRGLATHTTSPSTGATLPNQTLVPNHSLRQSIQQFEETHCQQVARARFVLQERLGCSNAVATVHKALLDETQEVVALQLHHGKASLASAVPLRALLAASRHPNVLRLYGHCMARKGRGEQEQEQDEEFVLMEYAPLVSLVAVIEKIERQTTETTGEGNNGLSMAHKYVVLRQLVACMKALGEHGIVHGDLSLQHVMVAAIDNAAPENTVIKISGYAVALRSSRSRRVAPPSVRWMAPESILKRRFDTRSDVWSFGVTAWELLTHGQVPFALVLNESEVARRVCSDGEQLAKPTPDARCSEALWTILQRCWQVDPKDKCRPTGRHLTSWTTCCAKNKRTRNSERPMVLVSWSEIRVEGRCILE